MIFKIQKVLFLSFILKNKSYEILFKTLQELPNMIQHF